MVMTDIMYKGYLSGSGLRFYGGYFTHFPAIVTVPKSGHWNIVITQFLDTAQEMACRITYPEARTAEVVPSPLRLTHYRVLAMSNNKENER
jgi:hypothetical protein